MIYEYVKKSRIGKDEIWVETEPDNVKHILSVIDTKKMIPIVDGLYSRVNINDDNSDTDEIRKYKDLLNKEYVFILKIIDKANKLYDKQMEHGKIAKFCCDFKKLEKVADHYK